MAGSDASASRSVAAHRIRIATWNVNSLKARLAKVEEWIGYAAPDVLLLQETKMAEAAFPAAAFASLGYESAHHGNGAWNGVAVVSRIGLDNIQKGFFDEDATSIEECRIIGATCGGIRVISVYVPNGRSLDSPYYEAKLQWLAHLREHVSHTCQPGDPVVIGGDFNIAPADADVWDPAALVGMTHASAPERQALADLLGWGLVDAFRLVRPEPELYSWWDYRGGSFHRHHGMRIDLLLCTEHLARRVAYALVDRQARKGPGPSDHAPVFIDLDMA